MNHARGTSSKIINGVSSNPSSVIVHMARSLVTPPRSVIVFPNALPLVYIMHFSCKSNLATLVTPSIFISMSVGDTIL